MKSSYEQSMAGCNQRFEDWLREYESRRWCDFENDIEDDEEENDEWDY